ncbi:MAG TPA: hypothetical protein VJK90_11460 [Acetobacteraceae bacterium]|nr:hypothetical protein [Acetobacteraceae bacterium]
MHQSLRIMAVFGALTAATAGQVRADVLLSGPDSNDGSYSTAQLSSAATSGDTVSSGGLTGISLWGLLGGANSTSSTSPTYGDITTSTPSGDDGKNAILRYYLLATGAGGQQSIISLGEIDPNFGGTALVPAFVAFQGGSGLLTSPELIVPSGAGRDLLGLTSLELLSVAALPNGAGGVSTSVQLSGAVTNPGSYNLAALQGLPSLTEPIGTDTYTGVPLWTFLDPINSNSNNQIVTAQGTDGYEVVYSLAELDPSLGGNPDDLLPYADTTGAFPGDGVARTITPSDNKQGRWVSNVDSIDVSEIPEPDSSALLVVALMAIAATRYRSCQASGVSAPDRRRRGR